jgi:hypothetical protein
MDDMHPTHNNPLASHDEDEGGRQPVYHHCCHSTEDHKYWAVSVEADKLRFVRNRVGTIMGMERRPTSWHGLLSILTQ